LAASIKIDPARNFETACHGFLTWTVAQANCLQVNRRNNSRCPGFTAINLLTAFARAIAA